MKNILTNPDDKLRKVNTQQDTFLVHEQGLILLIHLKYPVGSFTHLAGKFSKKYCTWRARE